MLTFSLKMELGVNFKNIAFAAIPCLFLIWLWSRRRYYAFALRFPGKLGLPIIGNLFSIRHMLYDLETLTKVFEQGQKTVCIWMGIYPTLFTYEPKVIEKVLNDPECVEKAMPMYEPFEYYLRGGLVTARGKKWRFHKKKLNAIFKHQTLLTFFPTLNKFKNRMIKDFELCADGKEHFLLEPILLNIGRAVMETSLNEPNIDEDRGKYALMQLVDFLEMASREVIASSMNLHKILRWLSNRHRDFQYVVDFFEGFIEKKFRENKLKSSDMHMEEGDLHDTPINVMYKLYEEQQCSRADVSSEVLTFIVASLETTSKSIYSVVTLLAMHPSIQQRVFEEIEQMFSEKDADVQYDHFKQLPYLERVILETMRVTPPFSLIARENNKPLELPNGHIMPENMTILISLYHLHRSKHFWGPNAEIFDPDNFLPENFASRLPYAYIPFSKGSRNCIGMTYALHVLKVMLVGLIRNYRFETDFKYEDLKMKFFISSAFTKTPGLRVYHRL